jgi:hypothetical protein
MLLLPEEQLPDCSKAIRAEVACTSLDAEINDVIAAILVSRFNGRTDPEICAMGGITVDDFTSSVAYRETFGLGLQEGQQKGRQEDRQAEAAALTLRLLQRRCGSLKPNQQALIQGLPLSDLENLADALLDFQGPAELNTWLNNPPAEPTSGAIQLAHASLSLMLQRPHSAAASLRPHRFPNLRHGWDLRSDRAREPGGPLPAPGLPPAAWPGPAPPYVLQRNSLPGLRPSSAARTW